MTFDRDYPLAHLRSTKCETYDLAVNSVHDPFARKHLDDPYPFYARLRARPEDLIEIPGRGVVVAARHEVARSVLRDHDTFRSGLGVQWIPVEEANI